MNIIFKPIDRDNWEDAMELSVFPYQEKFLQPVSEGLAAAYVKPWDEALDPYCIYIDQQLVGFFYVSYTPESDDNYWIGGFRIDQKYQKQGIGRKALKGIIEFIKTENPNCEVVRLTIEEENAVACKLYESFGFQTEGERNKYGEIRYALKLA